MPDSLTTPAVGKRARTRARLLEAATKVFAAKGFHAATLDDVAAAAGMTKGAIYGNFKTKEELFLDVFRAPWSEVRPTFKLGAPFKEQMRRLGRAIVDYLPIAEQRGVLYAEFQRYIQTHTEFRKEIDSLSWIRVKQQADSLRPFFNEDELGMSLERFLIITNALIDGLIAQRFVTRSAVPDDLIIAALERLA